MKIDVSVFGESRRLVAEVAPHNGMRSLLSFFKSDQAQSAGYSNIVWRRSKRKTHLFSYSDFLCLDVDEGLTIAEAIKIFSSYKILILYTRSHQVSKGLKPPCDRFRIIIPFSRRVDNYADYLATMKGAKAIAPFCDRSCMDGARYYEFGQGVAYYSDAGRSWEPVEADESSRSEAYQKLFFSRHGVLPQALSGFNDAPPIRSIRFGGLGGYFDFRANPGLWTRKKNGGPPLLYARSKTLYEWLPGSSVKHRLSWRKSQGRQFFKEKTGEVSVQPRLSGFYVVRLKSYQKNQWRGLVHYYNSDTKRLWLAYQLDTSEHVARVKTELANYVGGYGLVFNINEPIELVPKEISELKAFVASIRPYGEGLLNKLVDRRSAAPEKSTEGRAGAKPPTLAERLGDIFVDRLKAVSRTPVFPPRSVTGPKRRQKSSLFLRAILMHPRFWSSDQPPANIRLSQKKLAEQASIIAQRRISRKSAATALRDMELHGVLRRLSSTGYTPNHRAYDYELNQDFFRPLLESSRLLLPRPLRASTQASHPFNLDKPTPGGWNSYVWRATNYFDSESAFCDFMLTHHLEFIKEKKERYRQMLNAWRNHQARRLLG